MREILCIIAVIVGLFSCASVARLIDQQSTTPSDKAAIIREKAELVRARGEAEAQIIRAQAQARYDFSLAFMPWLVAVLSVLFCGMLGFLCVLAFMVYAVYQRPNTIRFVIGEIKCLIE